MTAFAKASDLGAEMWELDTQLTKDGVCVVSHDDHLQRVFGLDVRISELTAAELATLEGAVRADFRRGGGAGARAQCRAVCRAQGGRNRPHRLA